MGGRSWLIFVGFVPCKMSCVLRRGVVWVVFVVVICVVVVEWLFEVGCACECKWGWCCCYKIVTRVGTVLYEVDVSWVVR